MSFEGKKKKKKKKKEEMAAYVGKHYRGYADCPSQNR